MSDAAAHVRSALAQVAALAPDAPVPSPCSKVCRIDAASGLCAGCLRSIDEIAAWGGMDEGDRRAVWQRLGLRAAATTPAMSPSEREQGPRPPAAAR
ncbi:MAG: hypothetical protein NVS2B4_05320 [Ramlibacter sp.]